MIGFRIYSLIWRIITASVFRAKFQSIGNHTTIFQPLQLDQASSITIGNNVCITKGAWLYGNKNKKSTLDIMDGTNIGHFVHIVANSNVIIERNVLIADKVFISDCSHDYEDIASPILKQPLKDIGIVRIGEDSWIGENVSVLGAKIGKHCVIGANSVVTNDVPDYCVAVGAPAKIVKQFSLENEKWESITGGST